MNLKDYEASNYGSQILLKFLVFHAIHLENFPNNSYILNHTKLYPYPNKPSSSLNLKI